MSRTNGFAESLSYCKETCPDVDDAFSEAWTQLEELIAPSLQRQADAVLDNLCSQVKEIGTERLRSALCAAIVDKTEVEGERDDLQRRVSDLESQVDALQDEVATLERDLNEVSL